MTDSAGVDIPSPDAVAQAHSDRLCALLAQRIGDAGGAISFADYMAQALYEPGLGYYMAGAAKFGAAGDFITAPEVSPLYGATLGVEARQVIDRIGGGILELGAGSGRLALGILQSADPQEAFPYLILEPSAELVVRQKALLVQALSAQQFARVCWLETLPSDFTGVILANEVMDALPVERFSIGHDGDRGVVEQLVVSEPLTIGVRTAPAVLTDAVEHIESDIGRRLPHGYSSEVSLLLRPWLAGLAACLTRGVMVLVDYGYPRSEYYSEERLAGTLTCYYRHRAHDDPFLHPGLQDLTAHVDFTRVAESSVELALDLLGYASQSAFLLDNDLLQLAERYGQQLDSEIERIQLARAVKILTLPGEMGERFQVMALGKGYDRPLRGFRTQDLSYRL